MKFVCGSHKPPILPNKDSFDPNNLLSREQEVKLDVAPKDRVPIEIHIGQMSLHQRLTFHGLGLYMFPKQRIATLIRYVSLEVYDKNDAILARGADRRRRS